MRKVFLLVAAASAVFVLLTMAGFVGWLQW
jgi:hypothetical protein